MAGEKARAGIGGAGCIAGRSPAARLDGVRELAPVLDHDRGERRCGGQALCTTCRVEVLSGDTPPMSDAEREALEEPEMIEKFRLSCQLYCESDLTLRVVKRSSVEGVPPGPRPED